MRARYAVIAGALALALYLTAFGAATSPLADAAMKGDKAAVKALIAQKADVNAPQADGATAVQWAAYNNDLELADMLIAAGANVKLPNRDGATPLSLASINGSAAMIGKLLKAGGDVNEKSPRGETPLMFAARNGNVDAIKLLLDQKADINAKETVRGTTALMWASEQSHAAAMKLLIDRGADVTIATSFDSKGSGAYLAPTVVDRLKSSQGAGGLGADGTTVAGGRGKGKGAPAPAAAAATKGGRGKGGPAAGPAAGAEAGDFVAQADAAAAEFAFGRRNDKDGGGLTSLVFAARENCLDCVKILLDAKADINQRTHYGWTALLTATQNRHYKLASYLLEHGADPNLANNGGWNPLYIATDNRNIETGDYPVRKPDIDHLDYIKLLLDKGANPNARVCGTKSSATQCVGDSTETRTNFTMQWLYEDGATPFWRASQSGDVELMKLLVAHGADPKLGTSGAKGGKVSPLEVAAGVGWVEGVTFEWSPEQNLEAIKMLLDLGLDPNNQDTDGRTPLHGAAHKGRNDVIKLLVDRGARLDVRDYGSRDTVNGAMLGITWMPLHYAQGLVRVGVQSAIAHPETAEFIKKLMLAKGLKIPEDISSSICLTKVCGAVGQ